jgi:hypothetical protein
LAASQRQIKKPLLCDSAVKFPFWTRMKENKKTGAAWAAAPVSVITYGISGIP